MGLPGLGAPWVVAGLVLRGLDILLAFAGSKMAAGPYLTWMLSR